MTDLERINQAIEHVRNLGQTGGTCLYNTCETAIEALRFQKAALGEVSERMLDEVPYSNTDELNPVEFNDFVSKTFKAMIAELSKQVKENKE